MADDEITEQTARLIAFGRAALQSRPAWNIVAYRVARDLRHAGFCMQEIEDWLNHCDWIPWQSREQFAYVVAKKVITEADESWTTWTPRRSSRDKMSLVRRGSS